MQKYKCHKIVEAFQIKAIEHNGDGTDALLLGQVDQALVGWPWMERHKPEIGGYYVRYEDGYSSFSPAEAFEAGYRLLEEVEAEEKGQAAMAAMAAALLSLLDRIETEEDLSLARQRFEIAAEAGLEVKFETADTGLAGAH